MLGPEKRQTSTPTLKWIILLLRIVFLVTSCCLLAYSIDLLNPRTMYQNGQLVTDRTAWYNLTTGVIAGMFAIMVDLLLIIPLFVHVMRLLTLTTGILDLGAFGSCIASLILLRPPYSGDFDQFYSTFSVPGLPSKSTYIALSAIVLVERLASMALTFVWFRSNPAEKPEPRHDMERAVQTDSDKPIAATKSADEIAASPTEHH